MGAPERREASPEGGSLREGAESGSPSPGARLGAQWLGRTRGRTGKLKAYVWQAMEAVL
jgi:hypothetical protein